MSTKITQEIYLKRLKELNRDTFPLEDIIDTRTPILHKCNICGYEWKIRPNDMLRKRKIGHICPACHSSNGIIKGYNDMWTKNPEIAKLLVNPEDGYKYSKHSNTKLLFRCPDCGKEKMSLPFHIDPNNFSCRGCGNGISYPNRFMYNLLLETIGKNFEYEKSFEWSEIDFNGKKRKTYYDFYFEIKDKRYIVEMDGGIGHGNSKSIRLEKEESILIDRIKDENAIAHDIEVIRIDCNYDVIKNRFDYIRNNVVNSKLSEIIDLSTIDFEDINKKSIKKISFIILEKHNNGMSRKEIMDDMNLKKGVVDSALSYFNKIGMCKNKLGKPHTPRKVICLNNGIIYDSLASAEKQTGAKSQNIGQVCSGRGKFAGRDENGVGLRWMYYEDYVLKFSTNVKEADV